MTIQFITNSEGKKVAVILPVQVYEQMLEELVSCQAFFVLLYVIQLG